MNHLPFSPTPITTLPYYSKKLGIELFCKRDDLFMEAGGGSKARMLQYILAEVSPDNCDVLVTAGGPCSNFNRACALMCAKLGIPMHLIEYTDSPEEFDTSLNYYICNLVGIRKTRCEKSQVPSVIQDVLKSYEGQKAKFVYGGGKSIEGIYTYYDAVRELAEQCNQIDHVFIACGTGTTLTGVCAGFQDFYPSATVHAISVARKWDAECQVLNSNMQVLNTHINRHYTLDNLIFYEEFLCGGYDKTTPNLLSCIKECIAKEGMLIDPCYSGKAFYGMTETLLSDIIKFKNKNILFWNTGGLMNLLSMKNLIS